MNKKERKETALSESAQRLLGYVTQHAAANGTWSAKRKVVLKELAVSQATLGRALRELKEADLLQVVKAGGGAGKPTQYLITPLTRGQVKGALPEGVSRAEYSAHEQRTHGSNKEHVHSERVCEHDHDLVALCEVGESVGEEAIASAAGFISGIAQGLTALPSWMRMLFASVGIALLGGLIGGMIKGRQGAVVGALLGGLGGGAVGYLACPPSSEAEPKSATPVQEEDIFEKIQKLVDGGPEAIQRFNASESQSLSDWSPARCV